MRSWHDGHAMNAPRPGLRATIGHTEATARGGMGSRTCKSPTARHTEAAARGGMGFKTCRPPSLHTAQGHAKNLYR